ncbi:TPA: hypothetical protein JGU28_004430 [Salmonella enterica]|nr:hypothetical protein [Salmonella enterica]
MAPVFSLQREMIYRFIPTGVKRIISPQSAAVAAPCELRFTPFNAQTPENERLYAGASLSLPVHTITIFRTITMTQHHAVQYLLQEMTNRVLTSVPGFAEVMKEYNITTTYVFNKHSAQMARLLKEPRNFVADIHTPEYPAGIRYEFTTEDERNNFLNTIIPSEE